jgi:5'-phosphate synthase pdxT subunit
MGIFIRAPVRLPFISAVSLWLRRFSPKVITELLPAPHEPPIEVISRIPDSLLPHRTTPDGDPTQTVVALRQGRHLLTTFHPELTGDNRFHEYFVQECVVASLAP